MFFLFKHFGGKKINQIKQMLYINLQNTIINIIEIIK